MDWRNDWETKVKILKEMHPELEIYGSRNKSENIESHTLEGYEVHKLTADEARKLGKKLDEGGIDGASVKCGDMIVMSRPMEKLEKEQKELKELNQRRAKEVDQSNREKVRRERLRDF